jgi:methionine-rich copper-binding protein CopC
MKIRTLIVSLLMVAGLATPAAAHAFLQHASPGAGDTLASAPKEISLAFTKALEPTFSGVEVTDATGQDVEAATPAISGGTVNVVLKPLAAGIYHVAWHAVSVDAHRTEGAYSFTIKP